MDDIIVRSETPDDIKAIDVVNISAFAGDEEARLVSELRNQPGYNPGLSLVAEFHGRIVGHVMLSPVTLKTADREITILALAPMSVVPSQSHRGIGTELVNAAIKHAGKMEYGAIIVAGQPEYYERLGFENISKWGVRCNLPVAENDILARELSVGTLTRDGVVVYPPPFLSIY